MFDSCQDNFFINLHFGFLRAKKGQICYDKDVYCLACKKKPIDKHQILGGIVQKKDRKPVLH